VSRAPRVLLERLDAHHDVSTFDSGNDMLDGWLRRHALAAQRMDSARTFVATRGGRVVGYFSLTMGSVLRAHAPAKVVRGMPAYPVGMVLLARLAVDQSQQGKGVGAMLLAEALRRQLPPGRSPQPVSLWWTPSTTTRPPSTSDTVSSEHPSIGESTDV
jgi:GNAT superfamily N-acetyltransferase